VVTTDWCSDFVDNNAPMYRCTTVLCMHATLCSRHQSLAPMFACYCCTMANVLLFYYYFILFYRVGIGDGDASSEESSGWWETITNALPCWRKRKGLLLSNVDLDTSESTSSDGSSSNVESLRQQIRSLELRLLQAEQRESQERSGVLLLLCDCQSLYVGLDWIGLGWVGLGWVGLGWVGLDWIGLC
jgi:hypothetical protein